jgi:enoyl-CoA hydratase
MVALGRRAQGTISCSTAPTRGAKSPSLSSVEISTEVVMPITRTMEGDVAVLGLELGRGNAIGHPFIDAMLAALDDVERSGARAVVITGQGKVFCGGLDLVTIWDYDRAAMGDFVDAFERMFTRVLAFPRPLVAAVNGHALAGGCILAMAADLRVAAPGPYQIGLNEVAIGIPFPAAPYEIAVRATPRAARAAVLVQGRRFSPEEAVAAGIVHRLAGDRGVVVDAIEEAQRFAASAPEAVADTKADLVARALARIEATRAAKRERFLDRWSSPEARSRIGALRAQLQKRPA